MKRISAVICELNPLHDGHRYVFRRAKEDSELLIAVMSGNFVQRGESAVYDKYKRAGAALAAGADIVLELPFPHCASSAEFFAFSGVRIAEAVGADVLYFGSECGDCESLRAVAEVLDSEEYKKGMTVGRSAELRADIISKLCKNVPASVLDSPNDILGAEYCRFASIDTVAVKRISCLSASDIREKSLKSPDTDMLDPQRLVRLEYEYFRTQRSFEGCDFAECGGGVLERLYKTAFAVSDHAEWQEAVKTKQYTNARLRRAALFALCRVTPDEIKNSVSFTRLLGANEKGRAYLSKMKKTFEMPIISNAKDKRGLCERTAGAVALCEFADSVYCLCRNDKDPGYFAKAHPLMVE